MITSTANKQVKYVSALLKKGKARREERLFVAEGVRMCREIPPERIRTLYISDSFRGNPHYAELTEKVRQVEVLTDTVFAALSDTRTPQGVMAVVEQREYRLEEMAAAGSTGRPPLLMVLEQLQDPGNLGTILRAGEGAGATGILMDSGTADIYNPKVVRSTMGSLLRVPFVYVEDLDEALVFLKKAGIRLCATYLRGSRDYDKEDYRKATAFLIGNEGSGLSQETVARADVRIRIPMLGKVESLNAAVAASVVMYEAARQRRG